MVTHWGKGVIALAVYRPDIELLRIQLQSLINLDYTDWDCIVGIDGVDREVEHRINQIIFGDVRFKVICFKENVGFYRNFERILSLTPTSASWVALCDQDDEWYPDKLSKLLPELENADLVYGGARLVKANVQLGIVERKTSDAGQLIIDNSVTGCTSIFRRDLLNIAIPFPLKVDSSFHDHWIALIAITRNGISSKDLVLQDYVQHSLNVIGEEGKKSIYVRLCNLKEISGQSGMSILSYLVENRWGWRVSMARSVLSRNVNLSNHDSRVMASFAMGRINFALVYVVLSNIIRKKVPALRGFSLLGSSLIAIFLKYDKEKF